MTYELGTTVILDHDAQGTIVGRGYDMRRSHACYDVRLGQSIIVYNIAPWRLSAIEDAPCNVIGRDMPSNPKRMVP